MVSRWFFGLPVGAWRRTTWFMAALLVAHAGLLIYESRATAPTVDEPAHLAAGVSHWQRNSYELYRPNPPLVRMLAALPVLAHEPQVDYQHLRWLGRSEWYVGQDFVTANGPRFIRFLRHARLVGVWWSLLGAIVIFLWARDLWGARAGCVSASIWCFEPTVLGHGALITPDVAATVIGFAATYAFWKYLDRPSWRRCVLVGLLLGIAQLTKLTMLALYGLWPLLWLIERAGQPPARSRARWALQALAIAAISVLVINAGYGFHGALPRLGELPFFSRTLAGELTAPDVLPPDVPGQRPWFVGNRFDGTWLGELVLPVPADFVRGIDVQQFDFESGLPSYLRGELRTRGWWYYYVYAAAVKVPIGTWLLALWAIALALARRGPASRVDVRDELFLLLPAAVFLAIVSAKTGFNHHFRYVLPMFPFLAVSIGKLAAYLELATWRRGALVGAACAAAVGSSLAVFPHSLSYFNELAGGPERGDRHLIDSNIDWGQDLFRLRAWLRTEQPADPLQLAYFGAMDPSVIAIRYTLPPRRPALDRIVLLGRPVNAPTLPDDVTGPQPGLYAVSVNFLRGVRYPAPNGRGGWESVLFSDFSYFTWFRPIARIGHSIRIFCIGRQQANSARARLGITPTSLPDPACAG